MAEISLDENKLKEILKTAIVEVIQERKEIFSDLLAEIIELEFRLVRRAHSHKSSNVLKKETQLQV